MATEENSIKYYSVKDLPCINVVVFTDRAEVRRGLKTTLIKGENKLIITDVSSLLDQESVRVEGRGDAVVLDVVCQNNKDKSSESTRIIKANTLKNETKQLEIDLKRNKMRKNHLTKKLEILNDYANTLSKQRESYEESNDNPDNSNEHLPNKNIFNFMSFLKIYSTKLESIDNENLETNLKIKSIEEKLEVARKKLEKVLISTGDNEKKEIVIFLEGLIQNSTIDLHVSYVVSNASWEPKYDLRLISDEKSLSINYFGVINQSTGEDWNNTDIILSTAVPSVGGNIPELEEQTISLRTKFAFRKSKLKSLSMPFRMKKSKSHPFEERKIEFESSKLQTSSNGSTTTFEILQKATIPSDNNTHKVSIGLIKLNSEFEYESVPRKTAQAFIKAKVKNESQYHLLAGSANVFFDNNFVAKTELKNCSPQEEFIFSLGIDPAVKINYKPMIKYKSSTGVFEKNVIFTYIQNIEIKNTKQSNLNILVKENLPLSTNDVIQPNLKTNPNVVLNKSNILEFLFHIPPSKSEVLSIRYTIEYPSAKEIAFY